MRRFLGVLLVLLWTVTGYAQTASESIGTALRSARAAIAAGHYRAALDLLEPTADIVPQVPENERSMAAAAVEFYMAVALTGIDDAVGARAHLQEFFRLSPGAKSIDPAKFDRRFVALFNELSPAAPAGNESFDAQYAEAAQSKSQTDGAIDPLAVQLLGNREEKRLWQSLATSEQREHFLEEFWRVRDSVPATPQNEFRDAFAARVAVADAAFQGGNTRGAQSDRGRVFVLLGKPAAVRRRPLRADEMPASRNVQAPGSERVNGVVEQWVYTREQLPIRIAKPVLVYRFVTQETIGAGVLQNDDPAQVQALEAAARPAR